MDPDPIFWATYSCPQSSLVMPDGDGSEQGLFGGCGAFEALTTAPVTPAPVKKTKDLGTSTLSEK